MAINLRDVYPTKYYRKDGFVETKLEINEEDLQEIIEDYLIRNADFELEIVNNRPMNIWLYAKCRKYVENSDEASDHGAEVEIAGDYDDNPTGQDW
jgi:hypothetical protein